MAVTRRWPRPPDGAIHLVGDTHFGSGSMTANRKALWAADLDRSRMLPESVLHLVVGDFTDNPVSVPTQDAEAVAFADAHFGAGQWISAVGNHDVYGRTPDEAAQAWGFTAANYVHDLDDVARVIVLAPDGLTGDGYSMQPFTSDRLLWLDSQLVAAGDTPCLIVCHWSLYDTVGPAGAYATTGSTTSGYYAVLDADIRAVLADNPNAKAWLSGHIHAPLESPGLVSTVTVGGHTLAAVNASAPAYTGNITDDLSSQLATMYLTVTDGQVDVRFRDHGAGIWCVAGPDRVPVWSASL